MSHSPSPIAVALLALAVLPLGASSLGAQDDKRKEAKQKLAEAYQVLDKDPRKAAELGEQALTIEPTYEGARGFLGWLYDVRLGERKKALEHLDWIITNTKSRQAKADALASKANITYVEFKDTEKAIGLYKESYETFPTWRPMDSASNLLIHLGRVADAERAADKALRSVTALVSRIEESVKKETDAKKQKPLTERLADERKNLVKVKLQDACCKLLMKKDAEAKKVLEELGEVPSTAKYNLALLESVRGDKKATRKALDEFMKEHYKTPESRNTLREFIRTEPTFKPFLAEEGFKALLVDEPKGS